MKLALAGLFWFGHAVSDISISASTFEDFSTNFTSSIHIPNFHAPNFSGSIDHMTVDGLMQFNFASKALKLTAEVASNCTSASLGKSNEKVTLVYFVDFASSSMTVSGEGSVTVGGFSTPFPKKCLTKDIPSRVAQKYPSTAQLSQFVMMANMMLNQMPHSTSNGIAKFTVPNGGTISVKTNGIPVSASLTNGRGGTASFTFSNWVSSSGDMTAPTCTASQMIPGEELDAGVGVAGFVEFVGRHPATDVATEMLFGSRQDDDSDFLALATIFSVSAVSGAVLVLVLAKFSSRNTKSSPLLADV